jgi:hypothetical protein
MVDIPESLPGVPDVSCVSCRDMPLPYPSVSGSDAPPSRSDTPTYASSSGGPAALCTPSSSVIAILYHRVDHCTTSLTGLVYIGGSIVPFGNLGRVRYIPR